MLDALNFVKGAVAKKDWGPALTHFRIAGGRVLGYNGVIALSSPIDLDITASPEAVPFVRAIERCTHETTVVHMTPAGKLSLRSGGFKAYINCHPQSEVLDTIAPEGVGAEFAGEALHALHALAPFIGTDASRAWSNGILLRGASAFATNNAVIVERWIGRELPEVNIPAVAVKELLRIGQEPIAAQISERSATFFFPGDRWLRTRLLETSWPDLARILDTPCETKPFPDGFFDAVETLVPFVNLDGCVYFRGDRVTTCGMGEDGATVTLSGVPQAGAFHHKHLLLLQGVAHSIDWTPYPNPCLFRGHMLRGAILGMRDV